MTCRPHSHISGSIFLLSVRYWLAGHLSLFQKQHRDYNVSHPQPLAQPSLCCMLTVTQHIWSKDLRLIFLTNRGFLSHAARGAFTSLHVQLGVRISAALSGWVQNVISIFFSLFSVRREKKNKNSDAHDWNEDRGSFTTASQRRWRAQTSRGEFRVELLSLPIKSWNGPGIWPGREEDQKQSQDYLEG